MSDQNIIESDLQTQLESLFDTVWKCEQQWTLDNRIDLAMRLDAAQRYSSGC